jgi:hypothetical protein
LLGRGGAKAQARRDLLALADECEAIKDEVRAEMCDMRNEVARLRMIGEAIEVERDPDMWLIDPDSPPVFGLLEKELDGGEGGNHRDPARSFVSLMARADGREETMPIDATQFGTITINGKSYDHDVIIRLSGAVEKRRKRLSKEMYGTSHILSKAEAKFVFEGGCELLIVGAGQDGNVRLSPEATDYFDKKHCRVVLQRTPEAILTYNKSAEKRKAALMHVTC